MEISEDTMFNAAATPAEVVVVVAVEPS